MFISLNFGIAAFTGEAVFVVVIIAKDSTLTYAELYDFDPDAVWEGVDNIFGN